MKTSLCLLCLVCAPVFAAAPESLAGKVYRSYFLFSGRTNAGEGTTVLGSDGRYLALKTAIGVVERLGADGALPEVHWGAIDTPGTNGRYQYEKTGESTGVLTFMPDGGLEGGSVTLYFRTPTTGSTSPNGLNGLGGQAFLLTDLAAQGSAAVSNVSLRGRVAEGRPLIMGFVVPGDMEREVLIRVIGPTLASLGVTGAWSGAALQIFKGNAAVFGDAFRFPHWSDIPTGLFINSAPNPETGLRRIFDYVGAFPLPSGSKDCAVVIRLSPGNYSVVAAAGAGDPGGEALIELYALP